MTKIIVRNYTRNSYVVVEGEKSDGTFFIIKKGRIILSCQSSTQEFSRIHIGSGELFEVESCMTGRRRIFSALVQDDSEIIIVPRFMFNDLIQKKPSLVQKIILGFSQRMRELDGVLANVSSRGEHISDVGNIESLVKIGDFYKEEEQFQVALFLYNNYLQLLPNSNKKEYVEKQIKEVKMLSPSVEKCYLAESGESPMLNIPKGTMIFAESMPGNIMYFIQKGSVKICKIINNKEISFAILRRGDFFGEMALLENKPRSASAITTEDSSLLVITYKNFPSIIKQQPQFVILITTVLADRIWFIYRQITNFSFPIGELRMYDALVLFMEKQGVSPEEKKTIDLSLNSDDFLENTGMKNREGIALLKTLIKDGIIIQKPDKLCITNPIFVFNRAAHLRNLSPRRS